LAIAKGLSSFNPTRGSSGTCGYRPDDDDNAAINVAKNGVDELS
jgi:hypothetical protein